VCLYFRQNMFFQNPFSRLAGRVLSRFGKLSCDLDYAIELVSVRDSGSHRSAVVSLDIVRHLFHGLNRKNPRARDASAVEPSDICKAQ
jgi:hypothetical protein